MKTKEKYYAVRIGKRPKSLPYWMLRPGTQVPELFLTRQQAVDAIHERKPDDPTIKRVTMSD